MVSLFLLLGCNLSYIVDLFAALHELASASARTLLKLASSVRTQLKPYGDTLRWLSRVMQDHEARASDLNRKSIFSFFLLFSSLKLLKHNKQGPTFTVQQSPLISRLLVSN